MQSSIKRGAIVKTVALEWEGVVERPDGFYWQFLDGREYGPFASARAAREAAQLSSTDELDFEPGSDTGEALAEIGVADWIDPDTGEPAEEYVPRTQLH
jgi:hypothetical protein